MTQTRRITGVGGEASTLSTRWTLTVTRSGDEFRGRVIETLAGPEQLRTVVRSSWAVLVGNLVDQTVAIDANETLRSNKTLAYGGGVVVDTVVERSVEPEAPCGDVGPRSCVRVRTRTRIADPAAAIASIVQAMDAAALRAAHAR